MKRVTIRDIAKAADVSVGTVQRALNNFGNISPQTRERVKKIANEMGYEPSYIAQTFVTGRTYNLGVVVPNLGGIFIDIIGEVEEIAMDAGYVVCLGESNLSAEKEDRCLEIMKKRYVDGLIVTPFVERKEKIYSNLVELSQKKPLVVLEQNILVPELNVIATDNYNNVYDTIKYMIDHGRKRIGFVHWGATDWDPSQRERLKGYQDCIRDNGLKEMSYQASYRSSKIDPVALKEYMDREKPEIILGQFDAYTLLVMRCLNSLGYRIPEDVEIMGYDNTIMCDFTIPTLSSVTQPGRLIAKRGMEILLNLIDGKVFSPVHEQIKGEIVLRESTLPDLKQ